MEKERIVEINRLVMSYITKGRLKEAIDTLKEDIEEPAGLVFAHTFHPDGDIV